QGPVYMCYDAALQEEPLARKVMLPPAGAAATPAAMAPDPKALAAIADKLLAAEHPMLLTEYAGRRAGGFEAMVALAETTGAAVFPSLPASAGNASRPMRGWRAVLPGAKPRSQAATTKSGRDGRRKRAGIGMPRPSLLRASRSKSGTRSRTRIGCSVPTTSSS